MTSAWPDETPLVRTTFTPTETIRPVALSATNAANGPPFPSRQFLSASRCTSRIRSSRVGITSGTSASRSSIHAGSVNVNWWAARRIDFLRWRMTATSPGSTSCRVGLRRPA